MMVLHYLEWVTQDTIKELAHQQRGRGGSVMKVYLEAC